MKATIPQLPKGLALEITTNPLARLSRAQVRSLVRADNDATKTTALAIRAGRKLESVKRNAYQRNN